MIRALDGSEIEVDGLPSTSWGFRAWFNSRRSGISVIMSAQAGGLESSPLPDSTVVSEARSGSARLLALADPDNTEHPTTTFVYQGPYHELYTTQAGKDLSMDLFVDFLKPLDITDTPEGMQAIPRRGASATLDLHVGATLAPDLAVLTSYFTARALGETPRHRGQPVRGGEMWRIDDPESVLIANDSSATVLEPLVDRDDARFAALAQTMRITRAKSA